MSKSIRFSALLCLTTLLIKWTNSYVLLAANLEDFKKVAKKFVPEKLAMQIAEIATANSIKRVSIPYDIPQPEAERVQEEMPIQEAPVYENGPVEEAEQGALEEDQDKYLRESNRPNSDQNEDNPALKQMDFENLVQQVKKRIENDILNKQIKSASKQQKQLYTEMEPEYLEKEIVEKTHTEQTFSEPKYKERNTAHRYREATNSGRDSQKNRPSYKHKEVRKPPQKYPPDEYYDEKTPEKSYPQEKRPDQYDEKSPEKNYPQEKRPNHKEESYVDQEEDNPRQQSQVKQYHHGKKQKNNEQLQQQQQLNERPNAEQENNMHDQDEIDVSGKVVHNHQQHAEKQRYIKIRPKYTTAEQQRTVSPDPHGYKEGRYKENQEPPAEEDDDSFFKKINMTRQDSYEDYAMPKKEENPYASNESNLKEITRTTKANKMDITPFAAKVTTPIEYEEGEKNDYYNDDAENLKARTENLGLNYDDNRESERQSANSPEQTTPMNIVPKASGNKRDKNRGKATMIPKRDFYKISSPNYYAKIPIVAEKYDFNEPIPEKDREPEDTRSFPMPPSAINGKVRI